MPAGALPNLHPGVIHFPIALLIVAFGFDVACLVLRRHAWLDRAAVALFVLGAIGAWVAVLTGERAADSLVGVSAQVQPLIGEHHDWAERTAWLFTVVALARLVLTWADRTAGGVRRIPIRALVLAAALLGQGMLVGTADRGGALVYRHGLAVAVAEEELPTSPPAESAPAEEVSKAPESQESPEARLTRRGDGGLDWVPLPGDVGAIGTVLRPLEGSAPVRAVQGEAGLGLEVNGRSILVLPGEFGSVQVEAVVDLSGFRGTVGVVHHVHALDDAGCFEVTTGGGATLVSTTSGDRETLAQGEWAESGSTFTLAVSAAGRHLKGLVDGATTTHGHMEPPDPGAVGLLLDGEGVVRIHSVRVTPLEGH